MKQLTAAIAVSCVWMGAAPLAADDVHLDNGEVIEGKVTRQGDRITIELESGQITLSAGDVKHIERRQSSVERYETLYKALTPKDVAKRVQLADYCRDHAMRSRERQLLQEVIERDPDHAEARARLGYVKTARGWLTQAEHMRAQGKVQREGQWMTREQASALDRLQAQARAAAQRQSLVEAELEGKKLELQRQKLQLQRELESAQTEPRRSPVVSGYFGYGFGYGYAPGARHQRSGHHGDRGHGRHPSRGAARGAPAPTFPINGVRDPRDDTWSLPGVRDPRDGLP